MGIPSVAPPPKLKQLGQVAANDILLDADGKLRRGLLSLPDKSPFFTSTILDLNPYFFSINYRL